MNNVTPIVKEVYVIIVINQKGEFHVFGTKMGKPFNTTEMAQKKCELIKKNYPGLAVVVSPIMKLKS